MKRIALLLTMAAWAFAQKPEKPLKNGLYAHFDTEFGQFTAQLFEKDTPNSVAMFVGLAQGTLPWRDPATKQMVKKPLYHDLTFFRIVPGMAIQSGAADGTTSFDCGFTIKDEILPGLTFGTGGQLAIANGNGENGHDTGGCQFFITLGPVATWNNKYSIFGQVVRGMDVVTKIGKVPAHGEAPVNPPKLNSVTIERVGPPPVVKSKK